MADVPKTRKSAESEGTQVVVPLEPGARLGVYEIVEQLGAGKMGTVYRAIEPRSGLEVAVKTLNRLEFRDLWRLKDEAKKLAKIRDRNVVWLQHYVPDSEVGPYIVMEYMPGETLEQRLMGMRKKRQLPSIDQAVRITLGIIKGTLAAHKHGIVHGDLKPLNVFLGRDEEGEQAKLLDFGLARDADGGMPTALGRTPIGTVGWLSPELIEKGIHTEASDQYAIGLILYACLTLTPAYWAAGEGAKEEIMRKNGAGEFTHPRALRPEIPEALEAVVLRSMHLDPAQRYSNLRSMGEALLPFLDEDTRWKRFFTSPGADQT